MSYVVSPFLLSQSNWYGSVLGWGYVGSSIATCISSDLFRVHIYLELALWEGLPWFLRGEREGCYGLVVYPLLLIWFFCLTILNMIHIVFFELGRDSMEFVALECPSDIL